MKNLFRLFLYSLTLLTLSSCLNQVIDVSPSNTSVNYVNAGEEVTFKAELMSTVGLEIPTRRSWRLSKHPSEGKEDIIQRASQTGNEPTEFTFTVPADAKFQYYP